MKRFWPRILSAFSTLAVGLVAGSAARFVPAPALQVEPARDEAEVKVQPVPAPVTEPSPPPAGIMRPHSVSISPYEIKRLIDDNNRAARRQRGPELDLTPVWNRLAMDGDDEGFPYGKCAGNCEADISEFELDGRPGGEIILRLHAAVTWGYCYLIFDRKYEASAGWVLLGHVDTFNKWEEPQQKVAVIGARRWLVLGRTSFQGTGGSGHANDWYEVSEEGVAPVLSYQTELFLGADNPMTRRTTRVLRVDDGDGIATVVLQVSTSYTGYDEERESLRLWSDKRKATFIKGPRMEKFILDPLRSEITERELGPDYPFDDAGPITNEEFLKYNYRELLKIASERYTKRKDWLFEFLETCGDSVEKRSLLDTAIMYDKCRS